MTTRPPLDLGPPDTAPLREGSLEARASLVLKVLAAINVAGIVLAMQPQTLPQSLLKELAFNFAAGGLAALEIVLARAVDRRRRWAVALVRPVLLLLVVAGVAATLVGAQERVTRLPFEAAFAIWALLSPPDRTLRARADRRSGVMVASTVLLIVAMLGRQPLFGWGGLLDARPADLHASINVGCGPQDAGPPSTITVSYDWSWDRTGPVPSGLDMIVLGWTGPDTNGHPLYYSDVVPPSGPGIESGRPDYPSQDMASQLAATSTASTSWSVDLGKQGMRPGRVELRLTHAKGAPAGGGPLVLTAWYVHLGVWHSDPLAATCSWSSPATSAAP